MNKTNESKGNKNTYKLPETTIQEHLMAKAQNGDYKAKNFLQKAFGIRVV